MQAIDQRTQRLSYEPLGARQAPELAKILSDPRVHQFIEGGCPTADELEREFAGLEYGAPPHREDEVWIDLAVRRDHDGALIGRIEATVIGHRAEVAYLLGPKYWGQGFGQESLRWLHQRLAEEYAVTESWATIHPKNSRSLRLVTSLGYEEAPREMWPRLTSLDPGDRVFRRSLAEPGGESGA